MKRRTSKFVLLTTAALVVAQVHRLCKATTTAISGSFFLEENGMEVKNQLIVNQFLQNNAYQSECGYPFLNISTMDIKPSDERLELWKVMPTHHLPSSQLLREKRIQNPLFYPGLSLRQRQEQARLLVLMQEFLMSRGILAVGHGGIVLGALRHHGFVPWDSDIDFVISLSQREAFLKAVEEQAPHLAREQSVAVCRVNAYFYHWASSPQMAVHLMKSTSYIPSCPRDTVHTNVVPSIELVFTDFSKHNKVAGCSFPRDLRMTFTEGGVPFWTCAKEVSKWSGVMRICQASWNQVCRDDQSCGRQIFAPPLSSSSNNKNSSSAADATQSTTAANHSFTKRYVQWFKLIDKSELNPDGIFGGNCEKLMPVYNFADVEETYTVAAGHHHRRNSSSSGGSGGGGVSRYAQLLIRTIPFDHWSCYLWKSGHLIREEERINTTASTTSSSILLPWSRLLLSDGFRVRGMFTRQLKRNRTLVVSARNRVILDWYPPPPLQQKEKNHTPAIMANEQQQQIPLHFLTEEEEKNGGLFCELHITTRATQDDALWAKVMGYNCCKGGEEGASHKDSQQKWCHIRGDSRRRWTRIKDLDLDDESSNRVIAS